ncbi:MAG TPA: PAS domain S-box protein [Ktedonobacteraceae bacterium]|jgi:PAS domain S-box-containing protein|nr:PAS domain S-box protein [Ktedonobacteraceae bacterium]
METSSPFHDDALFASGTQFLTILESLQQGFISLNPSWHFIYANPAAASLLKKQREDLLGKNIWEIFPMIVGTVFWRRCYEAVETQNTLDIEDVYPPTGQWFSLHIVPSQAGVVLSFHETTQYNQHLQDKQRFERLMQPQASLMALAYDAIIVRDPTSRIISWNRGAERLYGWTAQEAIGQVTHDLFQTRFPASREALDRFLATGEQWEGELIHRRKDGTRVIVESRQVITRNAQHDPIAIMEINRDITERKQREQENQEQYRTIVQTANEGIWLVDQEARTLFINDRMASMLGYSVEELLGRAAVDFVFPEDLALVQEHMQHNLQGSFEQFDTRFRCNDGSTLNVLACTSPVRDGQGEIMGSLGMFTDLTERKLEEQARLRLAALVESADIPIIGKTLEGIITSWNRAAEQTYGYSAEEVVGQPITLIFPPDRQEEFGRIMKQINEGKQVGLYETVRQRKDGTTLPVSVSISPIYNREGQIIGASSIAHDITERKLIQAQERFLTRVSKALASTLDYQETLANVARLIVPQLADWFSVDLVNEEGRFELIEVAHKDPEKVRWARALREHYSVDPDAALGTAHVARTGQAELYAEIPDELLVAASRNEEELALARQIGFSSVMTVPLVARGKTIGVVSFVAAESGKRYTERDLALAEEVGRRAGVALDNARLYREAQQSRDQLDIILQGVADGIIVYAKDSQIIYANEAAAQMTSSGSVQHLLAEQEPGILGKYELVDERGQPFSSSQFTHLRVLAGEPEAQAVIGYREANKQQPELWSLVKSRPVIGANGEVEMVITIIHDVTQQMSLERRKDEFISMTSHELKTPVTSLKGFAYVLQRRLEKQGDTQGAHYLARMDAQLDKLTTLISDLLDVSRIQSGKLVLHMEPVDLDALIDETVENVQAATSTHHLLIEGKTTTQVMGDKERLGQVFVNLLTNAIKYSPRAQQVIVRLSQDADGEWLIVRVQDFGLGIDKVHHEKIFERFYQVSDPEEKTYPGLGIGLSICSEIVMRHQGRMWVESSKGQGSTFFVALPRLQADAKVQVTGNERQERLHAEDAQKNTRCG